MKRADRAENDGVRANRHSQRHDGRDGEYRRFLQPAGCESQVLPERFDKSAAHGLAAFFFDSLHAAEFNARSSFGFRARKTGAFQIVGAVLDVRAKFILHVLFDSGTVEELAGKGPNGRHEFHTSSGCVVRTWAMAAARRFQLSVSCRNRFRPATVNS